MNDQRSNSGSVIWITGLSASGKTTLAREVVETLKSQGCNSIFLDGDELRKLFVEHSDHGDTFDRNSRLKLSLQYSRLCAHLVEQGFTVVISTISMFNEVYRWNEEHFENYLLVFLDISLELLKQRDPKNIYAEYFDGNRSNVSGLDLKVDTPVHADITFTDLTVREPSTMAHTVVKMHLDRK